MSKAKFINAIFGMSVEFDLEELNIDWEEVEDYYIKWMVLHVSFKDGSNQDYKPTNEGELDAKWAVEETIYDDEYREYL